MKCRQVEDRSREQLFNYVKPNNRSSKLEDEAIYEYNFMQILYYLL